MVINIDIDIDSFLLELVIERFILVRKIIDRAENN